MSGVACVTRGGLLLCGGLPTSLPVPAEKKSFFFFQARGQSPKNAEFAEFTEVTEVAIRVPHHTRTALTNIF